MTTRVWAAEKIIGKDVHIGDNVTIDVKEKLFIGDRVRIGNNARIYGRNVSIGKDFYSSDWPFSGLEIGLGRKEWEDANIRIGERCTMHNNRIDLSRNVMIGDDVGLSPEAVIYTHGYWLSMLDGFPAAMEPVKIGNGSILGFRCTVLPGVSVGERCVVGAGAVISSDLADDCIYAGVPARRIRKIAQPQPHERNKLALLIFEEYDKSLKYRKIDLKVSMRYPFARVNDCEFDLMHYTVTGKEDQFTDDFREFVFRYGLRFYTQRPFKALSGK